MRIAISTSTVHDNYREGLVEYIQKLITNLANLDAINEYFIFMPRLHNSLFPVHQQNFIIVRINGFFCTPFGSLVWHLFLYPIYLFYYRIDVVHLPEYRRPLLIAPCKTIMTVHDLIGFNIEGHFLSRKREVFHRLIIRLMRATVDSFIAVSQNTKNDIVKHANVEINRIKVIYEGVDSRFRPRKMTEIPKGFFKKYNLPDRFILCVSRIEHPLKNHVKLLEAINLLRNSPGFSSMTFGFVGRLSRKHEIVLQRIKELNLEKHVTVFGYVDDEDLPFFYNTARLLVFPSLYEGFGFPVLEAYASGLPVICSNSSSLRELACSEEMLFNPLDGQELASKLRLFVTDEMQRMIQLERQKDKMNTFSWRRLAEETLSEYQRLSICTGNRTGMKRD